MVTIEEAYQNCEALTRAKAANFFYGIRLLPADKRLAMCAVYGFARRVDDIGDGDLPAAAKQRALAAARVQSEQADRRSYDPVCVALADARRRFDLPLEALVDLVDGVEMDVLDTRYDDFDQLVVYCRRVAGSVGRLCLAIFGSSDAAVAEPLSDDLGVALQLDEHPARRARGSRARARVPAGGRPSPLRLRGSCRGSRGRRGGARAVPGGARARVARAGTDPARAARLAQRRERGCNERDLRPDPDANRAATGQRALSADVAAGVEKTWVAMRSLAVAGR